MVRRRRARVLAEMVAERLPEQGRVLDVGSGDGALAGLVHEKLPALELTGVDVHVREVTAIPVSGYDGLALPFEDDGFDAVMLVDVLHHAEDPERLLREAARVAPILVVKDHLADDFLAVPRLRLMDRVGNTRHGVDLPFSYWRRTQWKAAVEAAGLRTTALSEDVPLYPGPLSWVFGRGLHFVARLERA
jgi:SAM-dependent methyltransferase